jgi:hypothetical protein
VNELLIDEEDFEGLRSSITTHDNFDQVRAEVITIACSYASTSTLAAASMKKAWTCTPCWFGCQANAVL